MDCMLREFLQNTSLDDPMIMALEFPLESLSWWRSKNGKEKNSKFFFYAKIIAVLWIWRYSLREERCHHLVSHLKCFSLHESIIFGRQTISLLLCLCLLGFHPDSGNVKKIYFIISGFRLGTASLPNYAASFQKAMKMKLALKWHHRLLKFA